MASKTCYAVCVTCIYVLYKKSSVTSDSEVKCSLQQIWSADTGREVPSHVVGDKLYFTADTPDLGISAWRVIVDRDCARPEEMRQNKGDSVQWRERTGMINEGLFIDACTASVLNCCFALLQYYRLL